MSLPDFIWLIVLFPPGFIDIIGFQFSDIRQQFRDISLFNSLRLCRTHNSLLPIIYQLCLHRSLFESEEDLSTKDTRWRITDVATCPQFPPIVDELLTYIMHIKC